MTLLFDSSVPLIQLLAPLSLVQAIGSTTTLFVFSVSHCHCSTLPREERTYPPRISCKKEFQRS